MKKLMSILIVLVVLVGSSFESAPLNKAIAAGTMSPPRNLTAVAGNEFVRLTWKGGGDSYYYIKRATKADGDYQTIGTMSIMQTYTDNTVKNGVTYYYVVTCGINNESAPSNQVSATPNLPVAPANLKAVSAKSKITLTWDPVPGADFYNVYQSTTSGGPYKTVIKEITATTFVDVNREMVNGTLYYYKVKASSRNALSPLSNEASATYTR
ncbi:hypothetical protein [Gorillibacterium sp. CAU 1737]|uniref:fibronectin type III domain-containing protein n=1 Tax=Gorillibacterium sp. CAU 1737 TaxID=3140362 RepID=UPI0032618D68